MAPKALSVRRIHILLAGVLCLFSMALVAPLALYGQSAAIEGTVRDNSGAVIPGAAITVIHTATNLQRTVASNSAGLFSVPDLPPGE